MNWLALLGILLVAYCLFVFYIIWKRPANIWKMKKVQLFEKHLGPTGTRVVFAVFGLLFLGIGIWFIVL